MVWGAVAWAGDGPRAVALTPMKSVSVCPVCEGLSSAGPNLPHFHNSENGRGTCEGRLKRAPGDRHHVRRPKIMKRLPTPFPYLPRPK